MAAAYKKAAAATRNYDLITSNAAAVEMEKHCMKIVTDAEKLATDAEYAAKYHHQRAEELRGK
jgi:hypothetical protein